MSNLKLFISIVLIIFSMIIYGAMIVMSIHFTQNCEGYLKRAADANTIEIAESQLDKALNYIEENQLTTGYTSVIYKTPDEDIGFWYNNLKTSDNELKSLPPNASSLEKSNMLIKLRETILDHGSKGGENVTCPDGISRYPSNSLWILLAWIALFGDILAIILIITWLE